MTVLVNAYATVRELPPLDFAHREHSRRDRSDPELATHLHGFVGFILDRGQRSMTRTLYHVMRHIQRVQHQISLEVEETAFEALADWAGRSNAILFMPDGTVRDPAGRVLVAPENGECEAGAQVPFTPEAIARKQRTDRTLAEEGFSIAESLPPLLGASEVSLRAPSDVARRALGLLVCALRAESLASGDPLSLSELRARLPQGYAASTPRERAFLESDEPEQQGIVNHAWRYEALWVLEWALGLVNELPTEKAICDVPRTAGVLLDADRSTLVESATLRPADEILDALDRCYRLHWAVREARRTEGAPPTELNPGVLQERHYALNWLVRFADAPWDDVDTPT